VEYKLEPSFRVNASHVDEKGVTVIDDMEIIGVALVAVKERDADA
jgi:hypothetical protein